MSSKRTRRQDRRGSAPQRKAHITIVVIVVVSLFAAWAMLAYSGAFDSAESQERKKVQAHSVRLASLNSNSSPSKEMVYAGVRLLATEEPCSGVDIQPPIFTDGCPSIGVAPAFQCPYATSAQANYAIPGAADNCPGVRVICNPAPGSILPVGTTTVTCTATDASGYTAACSFPLTVFSACLVDDANPGNVVLFNALTGDFRFCCNGVVVATGRGTKTGSGCNVTIDSTKGNRVVHIAADGAGQGSGSAYVHIGVDTVCQITDSNMSGNVCACS